MMTPEQRRVLLNRISEARTLARDSIKEIPQPQSIRKLRRIVAAWDRDARRSYFGRRKKADAAAEKTRMIVQLVGIRGTAQDALRAVERFERDVKRKAF